MNLRELQHPPLDEELRKLNLEIVPQGHVNSLVVEPDLDHYIKVMQKYDSKVAKIKRDLARGKAVFFTVDNDGTLFFSNRLVVPRSKENLNMTPDVMKEAHDTPLSIHPGSTKMYQDLRQRYWWSNKKQDIARYVEECDVCRRVKAEHQRPAGTLQPLLFLNGNGTRSRWTSSPVFPDHRMAMMPSLSSSTGSPRLLTFCQSRRRSLLVN